MLCRPDDSQPIITVLRPERQVIPVKRIRILAAFVVLVALAAAACGGNGKPAPTQASKASPSVAPTVAPTPASTSGASTSTETGAEAVGSIFNTIFSSGALDGATGSGAASNGGDPSLEQYLLSQADVPAGYTSQGDVTYRLPDGISKQGGMNMAASTFISGDPAAADPSGMTILMSMVIRPDGLTNLGGALSQAKNMTTQDLRDAITQGMGQLGGAIKVNDVQILDASGLGDGGFGMSMTIDMSALMNTLAGASGGNATDNSTAVAKVSTMTMRMYFFGKGDYMAGVMRMGFSNRLPSDVNEKALAKVMAGRLP